MSDRHPLLGRVTHIERDATMGTGRVDDSCRVGETLVPSPGIPRVGADGVGAAADYLVPILPLFDDYGCRHCGDYHAGSIREILEHMRKHGARRLIISAVK